MQRKSKAPIVHISLKDSFDKLKLEEEEDDIFRENEQVVESHEKNEDLTKTKTKLNTISAFKTETKNKPPTHKGNN